jgi:hypothetical protein
MGKNDNDVPVNISKNRARGGVTGHHVRSVLAFGLAGIIIAFVALGLYFGLGVKPSAPRPWSLLPAPKKSQPQGSDMQPLRGSRCGWWPGYYEETTLFRTSALGHERAFHTLIRHVRFSAGTRPRDAFG